MLAVISEHDGPEPSTGVMRIIDGFIEALTASDSATAFCRSVVHGNFTDPGTVGCQLLWLDHQATLRLVAAYGRDVEFDDYSAWADTLLGRSIRERKIVVEEFGPDGLVVASIPFYANGDVPIGAMVLTFRSWPSDAGLLESAQGPVLEKMLGALGAFYLQSTGIASGRGLVEAVTGDANPEDLTERQRVILGHMAEGQTNAQIARVLMLSESSIRQETVRIYRALGVKSRVEASKKGQALGLISKPALAG
jgi:DNA-binding CsgD family transcriptional regulator